jgi:hypothetical protein
MPTQITVQLERHYQYCNSPRRQHDLATRWADDPALGGLTPADMIDVCERGTLDQNPIVAALIRRHQHGDPDAGTIVLTAMRPMIKAVAHRRHGPRLTDDLLDSYWGAAGHLIGSVNPEVPPRNPAGHTVVFMTYLGNHLVTNLRQFDPAARRWHDRRQAGRAEVPVRFDQHDTIAGLDQRDRTVASVEHDVLARLELDEIAEVIEQGHISQDRWQQLLEHRLGISTTPTDARTRVAVHRTAHRLSNIIGHAA